ncbi:hypothetical protein Pla22_41670 [Rubripirellula amarantea]|uniref:Uncharacterized protein n=1 Tax=Rubripirellula amarantea TaxID=2527999 RepID=A0A5C5WMS6_9BACT|nr:sigma factor [Rubripirellula amarantea]TWT51389.1 hypothetical protein Pla22_41670 [Rubripirellula amarantea]
MSDHNQAQFKTTQWQIVHEAGRGGSNSLDKLCQTYWKPLYFYLRRKGHGVEEAQDLTQSFIVHMLAGDLLSTADASRGRFRSYLLTSLHRFTINQWRKEISAKRGGEARVMNLDFGTAETELKSAQWQDQTPQRVYERQWALEVIHVATNRVRSDAEEKRKLELFDALLPRLRLDSDAVTYDELSQEMNMTVDALKMAASRFREKLRTAIRQVLRETIAPDESVDDEVASLFAALRGGESTPIHPEESI